MPRDQVSESELFVAPAITPSRELVRDLPAVDPVLDTLVKAREFVQVPGNWCKGTYVSPDGSRCMRGAVMKITGLSHEARPVRWAALCALDEAAGAGKSSIGINDDPTTTHADVLALFDRAIAARKGA